MKTIAVEDLKLTIKTLQVDGQDFTLKLARQIPVKHYTCRWDASAGYEPQKPFICRVAAKVLIPEAGEASWLGLVQEPGGGLAWEHPVLPDAKMRQTLEQRGMWYDNLDNTPFILFLK